MEFVLHIGSHKTGTSALQQMLDLSRNRTIYYPITGRWHDDSSHNQLAIYFWDSLRPDLKSESFTLLVERLLTEISGKQKVIVSSEMIEKVPFRGRLDRLQKLLSAISYTGFTIKVLYVIRRQDFLIDSMFKQWVASYDTRYKDSASDLAVNESPWLRFSRIITGWQTLVGKNNVIVAPYLEGNFRLTLKAISKAVDTDFPIEASEEIVNPSLEGDSLRFKHYINNLSFDRSLNNDLVNALLNDQRRQIRTKTSIFNKLSRPAFLNKFEGDNHTVSVHFRSHAQHWLQPSVIGTEQFQSADQALVDNVMNRLKDSDQDVHNRLQEMIERSNFILKQGIAVHGQSISL